MTLQYLKSYQGMGIVYVRCHEACTCVPTILDAHSTTSGASILTTSSINLELRRPGSLREPAMDAAGGEVKQSATLPTACAIELEVLNRSASNGHRFKLSRLLVEERRERAAEGCSKKAQREHTSRPALGLRRRVDAS